MSVSVSFDQKALGYLENRIRAIRAARQRSQLTRARTDVDAENWDASLSDPVGYYTALIHYFDREMPAILRQHRRYFAKSGRGFGEDAFHAMWYLLFKHFRPAKFLEIGVFRGQALSLTALLQRELDISGDVTGVAPFSSSGDAVSYYMKSVDYLTDTLANFAHFGLPEPKLVKAYSTDPKAKQVIAGTAWDCIYIDGNHNYEVVLEDWLACSAAVRSGGVIILDDSGLCTDYRPFLFSTAGHPGPSRLATEIDKSQFREIMQVGHNRAFQKIA